MGSNIHNKPRIQKYHIWLDHILYIWLNHILHRRINHILNIWLNHILYIWLDHILYIWLDHILYIWLDHILHIMMMMLIRFVARTYPPCRVLKARIQKHRGKPLLFHDKYPGFFYVHYTTHVTYSFTSHPKDEAIMVKCLAQGRNQTGQDSNPHSNNIRT